MKRQSKLTPREEAQQHVAGQHEQIARDFASAEELLRYDAAQVTVPPGVAARLRQSAADVRPPARSWWQRLFKH